MRNYSKYILFLFLFIGTKVYANFPPSLLEDMRTLFPNENFIQLKEEVRCQIKNVRGEIQISIIEKEQKIFLKNASVFNSSLKAYSSDFVKLTKFDANSYVLKDGKYKRIAVNKFKETKDMYDNVFFDDTKEYDFSFPGVTEGTVIELNTEYTVLDPRFIRSIFLQRSEPIHDLYIEIICDSSVDLNLFPVNFDSTFKKEIRGKKILYTWNDKNVVGYKFEEDQADFRYFVPHVIPLVVSYKKGDITVQIQKSTDDLYKWYYSFIKDLNKDTDLEEMEKTVADITRECKTNKEKVQAIYKWVQEEIKYIAFEDGMGGFIPRQANDIFVKRYGDCKDNSNILKHMINIAGIPAYLTWVGTRDLPYSYLNLPSAKADNHMIVTYVEDSSYYFLDATGRYLNMDFPSAFIQGKEALVSISESEYKIVKIPIVEAQQNQRIDSTFLYLQGNSLVGSSKMLLSGYVKKNVQYNFEDLKDVKLKDKLEDYFEIGSNKFVLDSVGEINFNTYNKTMSLDYSFYIPDYIRSYGNEVYINLNLKKFLLYSKFNPDRETPYENEYASICKINNVIQIPDDYIIEYIPENIQKKCDSFQYSISYQVKNSKIYYSLVLDLNYLMLYKDKFEEWNEFINHLVKSYNKSIVLKKA